MYIHSIDEITEMLLNRRHRGDPTTTCYPSYKQARIQDSEGGFVQEFRLENRSYPDVHDFSLRMQVIIAND